MDDFKEFHSQVWENAIEMAESFQVTVFLPTGEPTTAVLVNDLVRLRSLPGIAKGGRL